MKAYCRDCLEKRNVRIELVDADYSTKHFVCPKCGDEYNKPKP